MKNYKLIIAYDGTKYKGWQKTIEGSSIESTLQKTLEKVLQHPTSLQAASRTDAGVHASGQVVNFFSPKSLKLDNFKLSLNALLPKDIIVSQCKEVPLTFHPTLDCISKEYHYYICYGPTQWPFYRFYSWHYHYPLHIDLMLKASLQLLGEHDFSTFCNAKKVCDYSHHIRHIQDIEIIQIEDQRLQIKIKGINFLYKMVRNIVGTLAYIGNRKISLELLPTILEKGERSQAGITAPAHGLFLHQVFYES